VRADLCTSSVMSAAVPREIYKWLQSLDLSYSIKNVKRDFSNGFLIAEIFSRYYPNDIQMHSFDYGSASSRKSDNWQQLGKFFRKREIPIEQDMIEGMIQCRSETAVQFLQKIYTFLTKKTIQPIAIAKDTGQEDVPIPGTAPARINATQQSAMQSRQLGASMPRTSTQPRAAHPITQESNTPTVQFREVAIKPADKPVAQLRASKAESIAARSHLSRDGTLDHMGMGLHGPVQPVVDVLNASVTSIVRGDAAKSLDPRRDPIAGLVEALPKLSDENVQNIFKEIHGKVCIHIIMVSCLGCIICSLVNNAM